MKCPNSRNEIHNSALRCPWCDYVISDNDRGYATEPVYRLDGQYGDPYYNNRSAGYNGTMQGGYDYNSYNNGGEYYDNYSYYQPKSKFDYDQIILPISIFILGIQLAILMLEIIVLLQL